MPQKKSSQKPPFHGTEFEKMKTLNGKVLWLTAKFDLSRDFAPFGDDRAGDNPWECKNKIWTRYLSRLGLASMGEVLDYLGQIEDLRHFLPREVRPCFIQLLSFRPYFQTVIQCLDSVAEIPQPILQTLFGEGQAAGTFATGWTAPEMPDVKDLKFPGLLNQCKFLGEGLANEIYEAQRRLAINCDLVMAVCPDTISLCQKKSVRGPNKKVTIRAGSELAQIRGCRARRDMRMEKAFSEVMAAIEKVEKSLSLGEMEDSEVTIRLIGEHAGGKTRFLHALLGDKIPEAFLPACDSPLELPLEIMHGEPARLEIAQRPGDRDEARLVGNFDRFPKAEQLSGRKYADCRLRLFVDEPRLVIAENENRVPKLLRLIRQPGWDPKIAARSFEDLGLSDEWENLALVYVCKAQRLEAATARKNLRALLTALQDGDLLHARAPLPLFFVITACLPNECREKTAMLEKMTNEMLDHHPERFDLKVEAIDFAQADEDELEKFRQSFWNHVHRDDALRPAMPLGGADLAMAGWPQSWALRPWLAKSRAWLDNINMLARGLKPAGEYLGSLPAGLSGKALARAAIKAWREKIGPHYSKENLACLEPPDLPPAHPLRPWLDAWWLPAMRAAARGIPDYLEAMEAALGNLDAGVADMEKWLDERVGSHFARAIKPLAPSMAALLNLVFNFSPKISEKRLLCTLLALSSLEARYR